MSNEQMSQHWSASAEGWVANEAMLDRVFSPVTAAILAAAAITPGEVVVDVGCGTGTLLEQAALAGATAVGVDISPGMAERARGRVPGASVHVADAQVADLRSLSPGANGFGAAVSRFGVMFFADPPAAFANIRSAMAPGGRLAFACWRRRDENPTFTAGFEPALARFGTPPGWDDVEAPGPVALARQERITATLGAAGWSDVAVEALDVALRFSPDDGVTGSDGVDERLVFQLGSATGAFVREQALAAGGEAAVEELMDEMRAELRGHVVDGAVQFPGACWIVTATA